MNALLDSDKWTPWAIAQVVLGVIFLLLALIYGKGAISRALVSYRLPFQQTVGFHTAYSATKSGALPARTQKVQNIIELPGNPETILLRGVLFFRLEEYGSAKTEFKKIADRRQNLFGSAASIHLALLQLKKFDQSGEEELLDKAIERAEKQTDSPLESWAKIVLAHANLRKFGVSEQRTFLKQAGDLLEQVEAGNETGFELHQPVQYYYYLGKARVNYLKGKLNDSVVYLDRAGQLYPDKQVVLREKAFVGGNYFRAASISSESLKLSKKTSKVRQFLSLADQLHEDSEDDEGGLERQLARHLQLSIVKRMMSEDGGSWEDLKPYLKGGDRVQSFAQILRLKQRLNEVEGTFQDRELSDVFTVDELEQTESAIVNLLNGETDDRMDVLLLNNLGTVRFLLAAVSEDSKNEYLSEGIEGFRNALEMARDSSDIGEEKLGRVFRNACLILVQNEEQRSKKKDLIKELANKYIDNAEDASSFKRFVERYIGSIQRN